jgi:hypothetical protein
MPTPVRPVARPVAILGLAGALAGSLGCLPTAQQGRKTTPRKPKPGAAVAEAEPTGPTSFPTAPPPAFRAHPGNTGNVHLDRFVALWNDLHDPKNGYYSPEGIPYHAVETLIVEAPDHGHETTSEAMSYWLWLEAAYGKLTGDFSRLAYAWKNIETYTIPTPEDQPTAGSYNDTHPSVFAPEHDTPSGYPSPLDNAAPIGADPLATELREAYGSPYVYGMHWILDVDNWYGFGRRGDGVSRPSYMNTFQRGMQESVWETIPQPSWESFKWGGPNGYLDLFVKQDGGYQRQWKYTTAPDADARAVQAMYWAKLWADEAGKGAAVAEDVKRASKLGDYLRYALFDKYGKPLGCQSPRCPAAQGDEAAHYLLGWYYAWGGSLQKAGGWSWRIGSSTAHSGYQNPFAAWILAEQAAFKPVSKTGGKHWATSLARQLELYRWLQSVEGGIAGGASNGWRGRYDAYPEGTPTFYKMGYDEAPVYVDPPSNNWFGFQAWSLDRVAQLYYVTGDERAKVIMERWVKWVLANTRLTADGSYEIPSSLEWSGKPQASWDAGHQHWNGKDAAYNRALHVKVKDFTQDVGVMGALARTLLFYAKKAGDPAPARLGQALLDRAWTKFRTSKGVSNPEPRADLKRMNESVYVPPGWSGRMPNGDRIDSSSTFLSIRSKHRSDPEFGKVKAYLDGGPVPIFNYHRFWAQVDVALASATLGWLYPDGIPAAKAPRAAPAKPATPASRRPPLRAARPPRR